MSSDNVYALLLGSFWGALYAVYGWTHPSPGQSKFGSAIKAAAIAFVVTALLTRGCSAILPISSDEAPECERHPSIYGC